MARKLTVLVVTVLQLVLFSALIGWRVAENHRLGWAGLLFNADVVENSVQARLTVPFADAPRTVEALAQGSPAAGAGLRLGDEIESVNGVPLEDLEDLRSQADRLRLGDTVTYRFVREGEGLELTLELGSPYASPSTVLNTASTVLVGLVYLAISLLVYWSRPRSRTALIFYLMCATGAAAFFVWAMMELQMPDLRGLEPMFALNSAMLALGLYMVLTVLLSNLTLHLALIFPRPRPILQRWPQATVWLHTLPFLSGVALLMILGGAAASRHPLGVVAAAAASGLATAALILRLLRRSRDEGLWRTVAASPWTAYALVLSLSLLTAPALVLLPRSSRPLAGGLIGLWCGVFPMLILVAYWVLACISLVRSYREAGVEEKHQVRWPLWGMVTSVAFSLALAAVSVVIITLAPQDVHLSVSVIGNALSKAASLLIPVSFAFAILKYRLMEIDVIIRRTAVYGAVTAVVITVYLALAGLSGLALVRFTGAQGQVVAIGATLLLAALFIPLRNWVQRVLERRVFRREHGLEDALTQMTKRSEEVDSPEELARMVTEETTRTLACRRAAVLLASSSDGPLVAAATVGVPARGSADLRLAPDGPVLGAPARLVAPAAWSEAGSEGAMLERGAWQRVVPVRHRGIAVAALLVGGRLERQPIDEEDEEFLAAVASTIGRALFRLEGRRTGAELEQAHHIQRALLPATLPALERVTVAGRWRPARELGGDAYDVLEVAGGRLAVSIADVAGKGLPAALLMSSVQTAARTVVTSATDPAEVVERVRSVVIGNLTGGRFVTFFWALVGPEGLRYCNAGHNPPILVGADGGVRRLVKGGPALARLFADSPLAAGEEELKAGDRVVLFTDGVTEAERWDGEQFGDDRLLATVVEGRSDSAEAMSDRIVADVLGFTDGRLQDDLTLVVVAVE